MGFRAKSPSDITGGYLVEFELDERWPDEESGFVTEEGQPAVIQSPKHTTVSEVNYIAGLFQRLEDSLLDTDSSDIQYQEYIDMESFVKKYLVEELSKNIDANKTSQYFYKYPDSISSKFMPALPGTMTRAGATVENWILIWTYGIPRSYMPAGTFIPIPFGRSFMTRNPFRMRYVPAFPLRRCL